MASNVPPPSQGSDRAKAGLLQEYWYEIRSFSPSLRRFLLSMSLTLFTAFGLQPVLQNLYLLRLGFDVQFIGLLAGIGQVVWAAAAIPSGMLGNRRPYHLPQNGIPSRSLRPWRARLCEPGAPSADRRRQNRARF